MRTSPRPFDSEVMELCQLQKNPCLLSLPSRPRCSISGHTAGLQPQTSFLSSGPAPSSQHPLCPQAQLSVLWTKPPASLCVTAPADSLPSPSSVCPSGTGERGGQAGSSRTLPGLRVRTGRERHLTWRWGAKTTLKNLQVSCTRRSPMTLTPAAGCSHLSSLEPTIFSARGHRERGGPVPIPLRVPYLAGVHAGAVHPPQLA